MKKPSWFVVNHIYNEISSPINNMNNIPICLGTIYHEPFEIGICYTFLQNNCFQLHPQYTLGFCVLWLHVVDINGHYFIVDQVINMASHGNPTYAHLTWMCLDAYILVLPICPNLFLKFCCEFKVNMTSII
jgi:hypothetical protein